ncbi:MAG: hypothetical protein QM820_36110 [Minicystis sp.]
MLTRVFFVRPLAAAVIAVLAAGCQPGPISFPGEQPRREDDIKGAPDRPDDVYPIVQSSAPPVPVRAQPAGARAPGVRPAAVRAVLEAGGYVPADEPAPTTAAVLEGGRLGHDPQVAVGDRYLIVFTAHHYKMFDKATGRPLADEGEIAPSGDFGTLFSPLWSPRDEKGAANAQNINTRLAFAADDPLPCDPEEPTKSKACVNEFYDSRIMWDARRKRFWIESAARNQLGFCNPPSKPCDKPWHTRTQARRYIAIAVSKTEDPRQGFHRYILVNQYTDWPKIAVNDHYLILGHRASSIVYVFDADKLAAGNPDRGPVRLAKLGERAFLGTRFLTTVTHHGPTGGMTYLLGFERHQRHARLRAPQRRCQRRRAPGGAARARGRHRRAARAHRGQRHLPQRLPLLDPGRVGARPRQGVPPDPRHAPAPPRLHGIPCRRSGPRAIRVPASSTPSSASAIPATIPKASWTTRSRRST